MFFRCGVCVFLVRFLCFFSAVSVCFFRCGFCAFLVDFRYLCVFCVVIVGFLVCGFCVFFRCGFCVFFRGDFWCVVYVLYTHKLDKIECSFSVRFCVFFLVFFG